MDLTEIFLGNLVSQCVSGWKSFAQTVGWRHATARAGAQTELMGLDFPGGTWLTGSHHLWWLCIMWIV